MQEEKDRFSLLLLTPTTLVTPKGWGFPHPALLQSSPDADWAPHIQIRHHPLRVSADPTD